MIAVKERSQYECSRLMKLHLPCIITITKNNDLIRHLLGTIDPLLVDKVVLPKRFMLLLY